MFHGTGWFIDFSPSSLFICVDPLTLFKVTDDMASLVVAQLLFLQSESDKKPIHMYINSPGGSVTAGLAIYDTMQYILPPIATWCVGQACSMGSLLLGKLFIYSVDTNYLANTN